MRFAALWAPLFLLFSPCAFAADYLGLGLGDDSHEQVVAKLKGASARYSTDYGYKGYGGDLPVIKVESFDRFNKFGPVQEAWLNFGPDKKLFEISVVWSDTGDLFKTMKDALDIKYGAAREQGRGFRQSYSYRNGSTDITLNRNRSGFGSGQSTSIKYVFTPALPKVSEVRGLIEEDIRKKNAAKVGDDL